MNRIKETVRVIGQPGRIPYRIVRSIIKGIFPLDFPMDSKAISNFIVKCRVYSRMLNNGENVEFIVNENIPGWITAVNENPITFISRAAAVSSEK